MSKSLTSTSPLYILLLGRPGAGKGTQAALLLERLKLAYLASGDLFRAEMKAGTPFGREALAYIGKGQLVPDELTSRMFLQHLPWPDEHFQGVLLDGFPRTISQSGALLESLAARGRDIDLIINIEVPRARQLQRMVGRRICQKCGKIYNVEFAAPKQHGICDLDGGELIQRIDDTEGILRPRLEAYNKSYDLLLTYYVPEREVVDIDGTQPVSEVSDEIFSILYRKIAR